MSVDADLAAHNTRHEAFRKERERFQGRPDAFEPNDYPDAVCILLELTRLHHGTGGAVRAAQVLLNAYNGTRFPFDPSDLGYLDPDLRTAAFAVMHGRVVTGLEPHEFFRTKANPNRGNEIFEDLARDYPPRFKEARRQRSSR